MLGVIYANILKNILTVLQRIPHIQIEFECIKSHQIHPQNKFSR